MKARAADTPHISRPEASQQPVNKLGRVHILLTKYDAAAKENAARRQAAKAAKRARPSAPREGSERFIEQARTLAALRERRMHVGFTWCGGDVAGNPAYHKPAFTYKGIVSDESPVLKLFVSKTHAGRRLKTGRTKAECEASESKLLSLDDPYVCTNEDMRGILRVELDAIFESMVDLCMKIYAALDGEGERVPMPQVIVAYVDIHGRVHCPHLIWILPDSVTWTSEKANPAYKRLFNAVARGLTAKLLCLGADPGGLDNSIRMKNPLSPLWDRCVVTDELYTLSEIATHVDLKVSRERLDLMQADAILDGGVELKNGSFVPSNRFFCELRGYAIGTVAEFKDAGDTYDRFEADVVLHAASISSASKERQAKAVAYRVARHIWDTHDPSRKQGVRINRGVIMDQVEGMSVADRKAAGGRFTAGRSKQTSIRLAADALLALRAAGEAVTQEAVANASGRCLRTVNTHWEAVLAVVAEADAAAQEAQRRAADRRAAALAGARARRCLVKKGISTGADKANESTPSLWIPSLLPDELRKRAVAVAAGWTPSCTMPEDDPWDAWGDPPTPSCTMTMASTPMAAVAVGTVVEGDIPF